ELAVLGSVLDQSFAGADELRAQVAYATVTGKCPCGCATIDIAVSRVAPVWSHPSRVVPVDINVIGEDGAIAGGIILFTDDGYLSSLEIYSNIEGPIV